MPDDNFREQEEPGTPSAVALPAVDGPTIVNVLVTYRGWNILDHNDTHVGLRKHGYLGPLMIPMRRGLIVPQEFLRWVLDEVGMDPAEFVARLQELSQ